MSYLSYLPFSMTFVSNDKLHKRCAPLFLATCGRMHDAIMLSASPSTSGTAMTIELKMLRSRHHSWNGAKRARLACRKRIATTPSSYVRSWNVAISGSI